MASTCSQVPPCSSPRMPTTSFLAPAANRPAWRQGARPRSTSLILYSSTTQRLGRGAVMQTVAPGARRFTCRNVAIDIDIKIFRQDMCVATGTGATACRATMHTTRPTRAHPLSRPTPHSVLKTLECAPRLASHADVNPIAV